LTYSTRLRVNPERSRRIEIIKERGEAAQILEGWPPPPPSFVKTSAGRQAAKFVRTIFNIEH